MGSSTEGAAHCLAICCTACCATYLLVCRQSEGMTTTTPCHSGTRHEPAMLQGGCSRLSVRCPRWRATFYRSCRLRQQQRPEQQPPQAAQPAAASSLSPRSNLPGPLALRLRKRAWQGRLRLKAASLQLWRRWGRPAGTLRVLLLGGARRHRTAPSRRGARSRPGAPQGAGELPPSRNGRPAGRFAAAMALCL